MHTHAYPYVHLDDAIIFTFTHKLIHLPYSMRNIEFILFVKLNLINSLKGSGRTIGIFILSLH